MSGLPRRGIQNRRLEMSPYLRREPWHSGPFEQHEDARHSRRLTAVGGGLLAHDLDSDTWIQVELVEQELVWMYSDNVVRLQRQRRLRKIAHVKRDKHLDVRSHRRSENMPVLRIVGHPIDQRLVSIDKGVRERPGHVGDTAIDALSRDSAVDQVAAQL